MSIFKAISSQATGVVLYEHTSTSSDFPLNVDSIVVTNNDTSIPAGCLVKVHIDHATGDDSYIINTTVPQQATLVYDTPFSFPYDSKLKVTTDNASNLTIKIN